MRLVRLLDTIDGLVKEPPSKEEVDRARTRLLKDIDINLRDSEHIGLFISEWVARAIGGCCFSIATG